MADIAKNAGVAGVSISTPQGTPRVEIMNGSLGVPLGPAPPMIPPGFETWMESLLKKNNADVLHRLDSIEQGIQSSVSKNEFATYSSNVQTKFDGIEQNLASLQSQMSEFEQKLAGSDVSMAPPDVAALKDKLKSDNAVALKELQAEQERQFKAFESKFAKGGSGSASKGRLGKFEHSEDQIEFAEKCLQFQLLKSPVLGVSAESVVLGHIQQRCVGVQPKSTKTIPNAGGKEGARVEVEFDSKDTRDIVRNGFRRQNGERKWESAVEGVEVWLVDALFWQHRNRPFFHARSMIAERKGIPKSSVVADKRARTLKVDGVTVAVQCYETWQVKYRSEFGNGSD